MLEDIIIMQTTVKQKSYLNFIINCKNQLLVSFHILNVTVNFNSLE